MLVQSGQVADELRALRDELCVDPAPETRAAHLAAMEIAATDLAGGAGLGDVTTQYRAPVARRRMRAFAVPLAATVGVLGLTCGLAAAGGLPGPAQRQVARVARAVGWHIPDPGGSSNPTPSNRPDPDRGPDAAPTTPSAPTTPAVDGRGEPAAAPGAVGTDPGPAGSRHALSTAPPAPTTSPVPSSPGKSGDAPGHDTTGTTRAAPGKSGEAPGHNKPTPPTTASTTGERPATAGKSGRAPGHTKDQADGD